MEEPDKKNGHKRKKSKKRRKFGKRSQDWNQLVITVCSVVTIIASVSFQAHIHHQEVMAVLRQVEARLGAVEARLGTVESNQEMMGGRMDRLEKNLGGRMDRMETNLGGRMDRLDSRLDTVDSRLDELNDLVFTLTADVNLIKGWIFGLDDPKLGSQQPGELQSGAFNLNSSPPLSPTFEEPETLGGTVEGASAEAPWLRGIDLTGRPFTIGNQEFLARAAPVACAGGFWVEAYAQRTASIFVGEDQGVLAWTVPSEDLYIEISWSGPFAPHAPEPCEAPTPAAQEPL